MIFKDEDIKQAIEYCLQNASNLLMEANLLYDAGRYPRAYCLAIRAIAELGKRNLLIINMGGVLNDNKMLERFHKRWLSTEQCLVLSLMTGNMERFSREELLNFINLSRLWSIQSQDAMGVEVYDKTGFTYPDDRIEKNQVKSLIDLAKARIEVDKSHKVRNTEDGFLEIRDSVQWLYENSDDKDFLTFINSKESIEKFAELKDSLAWINYIKTKWGKICKQDKTRIKDEKLIDKRWYVESKIFSYSHIWTTEALEYWNDTCDCLKMKRISDREVEIRQALPEFQKDDELYVKAMMVTMIHVVALNVGTFGHFWWTPPAWPFRFTKLYDLKNKRDVKIKIKRSKDERIENRELTRDDMHRTMMVFGAMGKLHERYFELYIKATTLMGSDTFENNFYTEAFSNYFLLMERFIKVEILNKPDGKKLDVKKMQSELKKLGIDNELAEEVKNIYIVRGRDAMHSRGNEQTLNFEEAAKCKIMCDLMLFKYCENKFKLEMSKKRDIN
ncbi:MAG: AbiV family abortive infection protein [Candidatus Omnitrophica bacterium]|nr:AbiV family abortive infection protein [Candidatus Omnitrophota bacterium]MDD5488308.1 AbiV family abortive infection protein [Candidatus Omnitrophota bacterium]